MMKRFIPDYSANRWTSIAMWWTGTILLVVGLYNISQVEDTVPTTGPSPGLFTFVLIFPLMAWGVARSFRIQELEEKVEALESDREEHSDDS